MKLKFNCRNVIPPALVLLSLALISTVPVFATAVTNPPNHFLATFTATALAHVPVQREMEGKRFPSV